MRQSKQTEAATSRTFQHFSMSSLLYVGELQPKPITQNVSRSLRKRKSQSLGYHQLLSLLNHRNPFFSRAFVLACRCNSCQTGCKHWRCWREPFSQAGHASRKGIRSTPGRFSDLHMSQKNVWEPANLAVKLAFIQRELELNQSIDIVKDIQVIFKYTRILSSNSDASTAVLET